MPDPTPQPPQDPKDPMTYLIPVQVQRSVATVKKAVTAIPYRHYWVWSPLVVYMAYLLFQSYYYQPHDYANSYFAARFFTEGKLNVDIYDPWTFNQLIAEEAGSGVFAAFAPNPPFTAIFFTPFALLPLSLSKLIFNFITVMLFAVSLHRLCRYLNITAHAFLFFLPLILFIPFQNQILFGQTYFLVFVLLAEGFLSYKKDKPALAAIFWSLAIFLKIFPLIILLFLVIRRQWKTLAYTGAACLVLLTASVLLQGVEVWRVFFAEVLPASQNGYINAAYTTNFQSFYSLLKYLFVYEEVLNPAPLIASLVTFNILLVAFKVMVLAMCTAVIARKDDLLAFGFLVCGAILLSPYGNTYGSILLLLIALPVLAEGNNKKTVLMIFLIVLIANLPVSLFRQLPLVFQFPRLLLTIGLFLFIFIEQKVRLSYKAVLVFALLLIPSLFLNKQSADKSKRLLAMEDHLLIYDYQFNNGTVTYNYWRANGENKGTVTLPGTTLTGKDVEIRDNQIFYKGRQLTNTADHKKKAHVLDEQYVVYLSDKDLGRGFYTLRKLALE